MNSNIKNKIYHNKKSNLPHALWACMILLIFISSCKKSFLDVVPDNVPTIDHAFASRGEAIKYLVTLYSYLPQNGSAQNNPAFLGGGDEFSYKVRAGNIPPLLHFLTQPGVQGSNAPIYNLWDGDRQGFPCFRAIRDCNIFIENIDKVPDMRLTEKSQWKGEAQFLKGLYHFYLFRNYGPIPIVDQNLPISASPDEVKVKRQPVDTVVNFIARVFDEAAKNLDEYRIVQNDVLEKGRATKCVVLSMKAKLLAMAASPLFNGNPDYTGFKNKDGVALFNTTFDITKWERAAQAAKEAIDLCEASGIKLVNDFREVAGNLISDETRRQMAMRTAITEENWSDEVIWGTTNSGDQLQRISFARLDPTSNGSFQANPALGVTFKQVLRFYTKNGVPVAEDKTLDFSNPAALRAGTDAEKYHIVPGYITARINFDREPRFYADVAFDGGKWYMKDSPDGSDNPGWPVYLKYGQLGQSLDDYIYSGYHAKKLINWNFKLTGLTNPPTVIGYPWPEIRLADLYLLYAEALNETNATPAPDVYTYINKVRSRAGIPTVEDSWNNYSRFPGKYTTRDGMREIIQNERLIELCFEGQNYWDIKRWKRAATEFNGYSQGWDTSQSDESNYYRLKTYFTTVFVAPRDYLFPIRQNNLLINPNLVQNPGW